MFVQLNPFVTSNVCSGEPNSVSDVRSSAPICSNARLSNIVSASNIRPSQTISATNLFVLIISVSVDLSVDVRTVKVKPTSDDSIRHKDLIETSNILSSKPNHRNHVCFVNLSLPTHQIFFYIYI